MIQIATNGVSKTYKSAAGEFTALNGVNLQVEEGELIAVVGKSGSGKSTLLNLLAGIDHPTKGEIVIENVPIHSLSEGKAASWRGRKIGVIFQFFQLLPTLTVIENVMLPMDFRNTYPFSKRKPLAMELLERVEVAQHADKLPACLSGGEQQRVAIARALANNPPIILADEPTGNLDSKTAENIFSLFRDLVKEGKTVIMVTHNDDLAQRAERVITIKDGAIIGDSRASDIVYTD